MESIPDKDNRLTTEPLVSVVVITYNSSKYVLETLESAKAQTFQNIELIVSDDCSTDNTVEISGKWIQENKNRFVKTQLITVEKNTGIPANCNRGVKASSGGWIKLIAGDDLLEADCIKSFVSFLKNNSEARIIESASQIFKNSFKEENFLQIHNLYDNLFYDQSTTPAQQYKMLLHRNFLHGPSVFLNKKTIQDVGLFDERYHLIEDHPMWLKLTKAGFKIHFLNKITVYYRLHDSSVFSSFSNSKLFNDFYLHRMKFDQEYIYPNIGFAERCSLYAEFYRKRIIDKLGMNRNQLILKIINSATHKISPYKWLSNNYLHRIEKQIIGKLSDN